MERFAKIKPLLWATIQKKLENKKILLGTRNDKSKFIYRILLLKVRSKDMSGSDT